MSGCRGSLSRMDWELEEPETTPVMVPAAPNRLWREIKCCNSVIRGWRVSAALKCSEEGDIGLH